MAIECYNGECIHHCIQDDEDEGPFCYEEECCYEITKESFIKFREIEKQYPIQGPTMTTTADKIKELEVDALRAEASRAASLPEPFGSTLAQLFTEIADYTIEMKKRVKPPDREPLECWARIDENGEPVSLGFNNPAPGSRYVIRLIQVTPEMKQNDLDAKRYQKLKELHCATGPAWIYTPWQWDKRLDEVLDEG